MMDHNQHTCLAASTGIAIFIALAVSGCQQPDRSSPDHSTEQAQPTAATHAQANDVEAQAAARAVLTKIEFPVYIQGIPALLHPVTPLQASEGGYDISSIKSKKGEYYPVFEENDHYDYRTYATNIVFEDIATHQTQKLISHNNFIISQVFFPHITRSIAKSANPKPEALAADTPSENANGSTQLKTVTTPFNHAIYHIAETPYKDADDDHSLYKQSALYMSDNHGKGLIKLHPDNEFVQAVEWNPQVSRYYFITQSDSDNNGLIDDKDQRYNYQIDFKATAPVAKRYEFK